MADNPMEKKKIALIGSVVVLIAVVGVLLRGSFSSSPPSRQELGSSSLSATDDKGDKWILELAQGPLLYNSNDESMRTGAPLLIRTDVQIVGRDVSIGLIVEGQAGETYVPGVQKNGQWQPEPGLAIIDEAGKTLDTGKFKYG